MTTTDAHRDIAVDTLAATKAVIDHMDTLHAQQHRLFDAPNGYVSEETQVGRTLGEAREKVRYGLKFAEINALVAISDRLTEVTLLMAERAGTTVINTPPGPLNGQDVVQLVDEYSKRVGRPVL